MIAATTAMAQDRFDLGAIETVVVTGEQTESWFNTLDATIPAGDLLRFERYDVSEAVNMLPGVTVQNVGGRSERLVFVRGFNSRQVPMFIDGIPVYVPYDGNVDLVRFTTLDVAEITVTKSLTSVLYGANTLGGSINLVSRRPIEPLEFAGGAGLVLDDSVDASRYRVWLNAGANQGDWYAQLSGSWDERDHFRIPGGFTPTTVENGGRRENAESTDYKFSAKVGYAPNETDEYALSYSHQQGEKQTPPYAGSTPGVRARFWRWPAWDKESLYFLSNTQLGEVMHVKLKAYYDTFDNTLSSFDDDTYTTQFRPFAFNSVYDDYTLGGGIELGTTHWAGHNLRAAFHYKRDIHRETDDDGLPEERYEDEIWSLGIEDSVRIGDRARVVAGLSYDHQSGLQADFLDDSGGITPFPTASESAFNAQGAVLFSMRSDTELHISVAHRTRFPTIKDRYSFRLGAALPNPSLVPEAAVHFEAGLDAELDAFRYGVNLFYSDLDDAIENVTIDASLCSQPPCVQLQNVGRQRHLGVETFGRLVLGDRLQLYANYTFLDRDNKSDASIIPIDVPKNKVFAYADYAVTGDVNVVLSGEYNSKRHSSTVGDRIAESFFVAGLKASWRVTDSVQLDAGVHNLFDKYYELEEGFPEPGRSAYLNLRFNY